MLNEIYPNGFKQIILCDWHLSGVTQGLDKNTLYQHINYIHLGGY